MPRILKQNNELRWNWQAEVDEFVTGVAYAPQGDKLAIITAAGSLFVYESHSGTLCYQVLAHEQGCLTLSWAASGQWLATGGQDGTAVIWAAETGDKVAELAAGAAWVEHLAWSPTQDWLLTASGKFLKLWNAGGELQQSFNPTVRTVAAIQWHPQQAEFASINYKQLELWQPVATTALQALPWIDPLLKLAWSRNGQLIACGCQGGSLHVWSLADGEEWQMGGYPQKVTLLDWNQSTEYLATGAAEDIVIWDFQKGNPAETEPTVLRYHERRLTALAFHPQERGLLASADEEGVVMVWHTPREMILKVNLQDEEAQAVSHLQWSPNGEQLATGHQAGRVVVWQVF